MLLLSRLHDEDKWSEVVGTRKQGTLLDEMYLYSRNALDAVIHGGRGGLWVLLLADKWAFYIEVGEVITG